MTYNNNNNNKHQKDISLLRSFASSSTPSSSMHQPSSLTTNQALHLLSAHSASLPHLKQIHAQITRQNLLPSPSLSPTLLRLYSSHSLSFASLAFSLIPHPPTALSWNHLIRAHVLHSRPLPALLLFRRMLLSGGAADKFTLTFVSKALAALSDLQNAMALHAFAIKAALYHNNLHYQNTLIHLYFACDRPDLARQVFDRMRVRTVVSWTAFLSGVIASGEIGDARKVFERMPVKNVVSWTAMIDGCGKNGRPAEAVALFWRMLEEKVRPNEFTLVALLLACSELGSLTLGRWVHEFARENGVLERKGLYVGTALIDMYSKCGSLDDARKVFDEMPVKSLVTWNSMLTSLGVHGRGKEAVALFAEMERRNVRPDEITLVGILCACTKEGMMEEGLRLFRYVNEKYVIEPIPEHYRCLTELLGCGDAEMVKNLIMELNGREQKMVLMASREHHDSNLGEVISSCLRESGVDCFQWEVG